MMKRRNLSIGLQSRKMRPLAQMKHPQPDLEAERITAGIEN